VLDRNKDHLLFGDREDDCTTGHVAGEDEVGEDRIDREAEHRSSGGVDHLGRSHRCRSIIGVVGDGGQDNLFVSRGGQHALSVWVDLHCQRVGLVQPLQVDPQVPSKVAIAWGL
jgi:hypothetical protein